MTKVSAIKRDRMLQMYKEGYQPKEVAKELDMHIVTVRTVRRGLIDEGLLKETEVDDRRTKNKNDDIYQQIEAVCKWLLGGAVGKMPE